jgi:hypothetical protein
MCTLEHKIGLLGTLLGGRKRGIQPDALEALHSVLTATPEISGLRWFTDADYLNEENGQPTPTA